MEFNIVNETLAGMGLSPLGVLIGFFGSLVGALVINDNGLDFRRIILSVSSAMLVCGFIYDLAGNFTDTNSIRSLATIYVSIIAPDVFVVAKGSGKTVTGRIFTMIGGALKRFALTALGGTEKPTNDE